MSSAEAKLRASHGDAESSESHSSRVMDLHLDGAKHKYSVDEAVLIRQAQAGRWEAFTELAGGYDSPLLALALRLTGSEREARELFQRAFVRAYRELPSYRFHCSFYLWIYRVVAHTCMQFLQQRSSDAPAQGSTFAAALGQLSPRERIVLELKHYFGLKLETIASILETTEAVTRSTLVRAVLMLRLECEKQRHVS